MESRICGHCGQQFYSPTKPEKKSDKAFPLKLVLFPIFTWFFIAEGGWCWFGALFCIFFIISEIRDKIARNKAKEGKLVSPDRTCPLCDDKSADVDSPLGRQLILKWSDPSKMDSEFIDSLRSIVSSVDDADSSRRKQLIAKQPSPPAIDSQYIDAAPSIIPFVGDGNGEVVGDG